MKLTFRCDGCQKEFGAGDAWPNYYDLDYCKECGIAGDIMVLEREAKSNREHAQIWLDKAREQKAKIVELRNMMRTSLDEQTTELDRAVGHSRAEG